METLDSLFNEYEKECEAKFEVEKLMEKIKEKAVGLETKRVS